MGAERTPVYDKSWQVEDPNTFGTDEYVKWCRKVGAEPYICTNAGTGNPEEMSDWVEYCNLSIGKYGRKRMANGHVEPMSRKIKATYLQVAFILRTLTSLCACYLSVMLYFCNLFHFVHDVRDVFFVYRSVIFVLVDVELYQVQLVVVEFYFHLS